MRSLRIIIVLATVLAALAGCGDGDGDDGDSEIANPAAVYCEELGGTVSGDEPMCTLPDGTVVDAWELWRSDHPTEDTDG